MTILLAIIIFTLFSVLAGMFLAGGLDFRRGPDEDQEHKEE